VNVRGRWRVGNSRKGFEGLREMLIVYCESEKSESLIAARNATCSVCPLPLLFPGFALAVSPPAASPALADTPPLDCVKALDTPPFSLKAKGAGTRLNTEMERKILPRKMAISGSIHDY
jgi:hypothetical protein